MSTLLYGHNATARIVAVQQKDERTMRVYFREGPAVRYEDARFFPFFFLANENSLAGFPAKHWLKELNGPGFYKYLCVFEEWPDLWSAVRWVIDHYNRNAVKKVETYAGLEDLLLYADPTAQFLLETGQTLFKELTFQDLHRLQLDIETYTSAHRKFSNAQRSGDRIILIALSDNRGWSHLVDGKKLDEQQMLRELVRIIREKDPDVIEGHNIYGFDLPYILRRCELHEVPFTIGRDGTSPRLYDARSSFAERSFEYTVADIAGRHIVDTLLLVQSYDVTKRNLESYGLKYAAEYFGIASPGRTYIKGDRISWHWDHDPAPLMNYAMNDVEETRGLSDQLSGASFYLTQMLPFNYSQVARMGSASKIESLLVREYLRQKQAIPKPMEGIQTTGGYTDIFTVGIVGPVLHADVESLYPSIMIGKGIAPASDVMQVFRELLRELTAMRLDAKRSMKRVSDANERQRLDAMQSSFKILINSFYGYLGYARGLFNDYTQADIVTRTGQELLRTMIAGIQSRGGKVIEVDTDGIFFVPPATVMDEHAEEEFVAQLSWDMPEGITVALDGRYRKMLSYKMKNYALLDYEDRVKVKGSSLISRSMERFGRSYVHEGIQLLFRNDIEGLHALFLRNYHTILDHKLDVREFSRTEALRDSLADYERDVESGKRNRTAAYEVARATGKPYRPGDRVTYYITGSDPRVRGFENCKPAEEWDPNFPDENVRFYVKRLDEFSEKFGPFFHPQAYRAVFSADDLFPFDPHGISIVTREAAATDDARGDEGQEGGSWPGE